MDKTKVDDLIASLQNPMVTSFLLQLHFLCGELEGFNIIGKVLPTSRPTLAEARTAIVAKIKAVWEAFGVRARQTLGMEPEEVPAWQSMAMEMFKNLQEEMDLVEADPEALAGLLDLDLIPGPGQLH